MSHRALAASACAAALPLHRRRTSLRIAFCDGCGIAAAAEGCWRLWLLLRGYASAQRSTPARGSGGRQAGERSAERAAGGGGGGCNMPLHAVPRPAPHLFALLAPCTVRLVQRRGLRGRLGEELGSRSWPERAKLGPPAADACRVCRPAGDWEGAVVAPDAARRGDGSPARRLISERRPACRRRPFPHPQPHASCLLHPASAHAHQLSYPAPAACALALMRWVTKGGGRSVTLACRSGRGEQG